MLGLQNFGKDLGFRKGRLGFRLLIGKHAHRPRSMGLNAMNTLKAVTTPGFAQAFCPLAHEAPELSSHSGKFWT